MVPTVRAFIRLARLRRLNSSGCRISGVWCVITYMLQRFLNAAERTYSAWTKHCKLKATSQVLLGYIKIATLCHVLASPPTPAPGLSYRHATNIDTSALNPTRTIRVSHNLRCRKTTKLQGWGLVCTQRCQLPIVQKLQLNSTHTYKK